MEGGSLRDYLHKVKDPLKDWAEKYALKGRTRMTREEIAVCAKSVMEAIQFLYDKGFPAMGHIQTGNIFKTEEGYKLGGYENVLLGYKSRDHQLCLEYGKDMDIIMLGKCTCYSQLPSVPVWASIINFVEGAYIKYPWAIGTKGAGGQLPPQIFWVTPLRFMYYVWG